MRLHKPVVLAVVIGISNAEHEQGLHLPGLRRQNVRNVSSIPYSLASFTSPSFSNSLFGTGTGPASHGRAPSPTGHVVSGNSSIHYSPTGTAPAPHHGSNGSCGQPTLNVLDASLDYWYTSTVYNAVSTFSIQFNSDDSPIGWTLLPATTPFNLSSALGDATPTAAQTTVITQTAYDHPNATTGKGQIPNVIVTPPPASITIPSYSTTFSSRDSAFIHFDKYEVISKTAPAYGYLPGCVAVTNTYTLETPFAFPYNGPSGNFSGAGVTGAVNSAFLGVVGQSFAVAGSWKAAPTVAIVVQKVFAAEAVLAASIEATQKSLLVPSATLPSFLSPIHPKTTKEILPNGNPKGHTETTASFLLVPTPAPTKTVGGGSDGGNGPRATPTAEPQGSPPNMVPFVAHLEDSDTTLLVPTPGTTAVITTKVEGILVTATRAPQGGHPEKGSGGGGGGGKGTIKVGAVHASPSNAFAVLSEALASAKDSRPAATGGNQGGSGPHDSSSGSGNPVPIIVVGQKTFTGDSQTHFSLQASKTLTPGGVANIGGTSLSLLPGGLSVVINGQTEAVSTAVITPAPALTIGPHVFHATGGSTYVINGKTLTPGDEETVSVRGKTYILSLAPGAPVLKIETIGANGQVTATMYETLFPAGSQATGTSIISACSTSIASKNSAANTAKSTGPEPNLQNGASGLSVRSAAVAIGAGAFALAAWL